MKTTTIMTVLVMSIATSTYAQKNSLNSKASLGFQLNQYQNDFGLGVHLTSPFFWNEQVAARVRGNLAWNEHPDQSNEIQWSSYSNASFGFVSKAGQVGEFIRLYGEGGVLFIFPSSNFSTAETEVGGYGLFGFEFFMSPYTNYFIEIGGVGTGAKADKIAGNPIYSNGMLINVGFRYQF